MRNKEILIRTCAVVLILNILLAFITSKTVSVLAENKTLTSDNRIIIDPGHGGEDGGATSCSGVLESHINLEIATRLRDMLNFLGFATIMVRTDDSALHTCGNTIAQRKISDLKNRVQLVNCTENALLLSIHQNYFPENRYYGAQVFYANTTGSRRLAEMIQVSFRTTVNPKSNRTAKEAQDIYILDRISCDGVLIECGFLSNYREETLLRNHDYQKKICAIIAAATSVYLKEESLLT